MDLVTSFIRIELLQYFSQLYIESGNSNLSLIVHHANWDKEQVKKIHCLRAITESTLTKVHKHALYRNQSFNSQEVHEHTHWHGMAGSIEHTGEHMRHKRTSREILYSP